jgi:hypothetical protein
VHYPFALVSGLVHRRNFVHPAKAHHPSAVASAAADIRYDLLRTYILRL